jgi:hypothetical protein
MNVDEDMWDRILAFIEEGTLVPVLGPELLEIDGDGVKGNLYRLIAEHLVRRYKLSLPAFTPYAELDEAVRGVLKSNPRAELYVPIRDFLVKATKLPTPMPLRQLAEIRQLSHFVATTFDGLMVRALDEVRGTAAGGATYLTFAPNRSREDVEASLRRPPADRPMVFALFGKVAASPTYAINDEDILEFVHALVTLSALSSGSWHADELRKRNLLLLGCHFSDWVSRFIVRVVSANRLSLGSDRKVIIVGEGIGPDSAFAEFVDLFSRGTTICDGSAIEFVAELHDRWLARNPDAAAVAAGDTLTFAATGRERHGSIFISYVREDVAAARAFQSAIEGIGGDVWLDERILEPGDSWENEILDSIRHRVRLFVPLISQQTERCERGFVFKEWEAAVDRSRELPPGGRNRFIVPVVIDQDYRGDPSGYRQIEDCFREFNFGHAPNGVPDDALMSALKSELRALRR